MESVRPRNLTDYLRAARRRRLIIIVSACVVAAAGFIAIKRMPDLYESSTFIIVESPNAESSSDHGATSIDLPRRLATIRQQVTSRTRLEGIIAKYRLYQDSIDRGARLDDIIAGMRTSIDVEVN